MELYFQTLGFQYFEFLYIYERILNRIRIRIFGIFILALVYVYVCVCVCVYALVCMVCSTELMQHHTHLRVQVLSLASSSAAT